MLRMYSHLFKRTDCFLTYRSHAGYSYSGATAAWSYKAFDLSNAERVFILGPSHAMALSGCAITSRDYYATPFGNLRVDRLTVEELSKTGEFKNWATNIEEAEHSLEMHLPYLYKSLERIRAPEDFPTIIPILVGTTSAAEDQTIGKILAPYLADPTTAFIISSDFCHWGFRFRYSRYLTNEMGRTDRGIDINPRQFPEYLPDPLIWQSIAMLDNRSMDAIRTGSHAAFLEDLRLSGNTVCGRHPIAVVLCAIEELRRQRKVAEDGGKFEFIRYERSEDITKVSESSVSYVAGYAVVDSIE